MSHERRKRWHKCVTAPVVVKVSQLVLTFCIMTLLEKIFGFGGVCLLGACFVLDFHSVQLTSWWPWVCPPADNTTLLAMQNSSSEGLNTAAYSAMYVGLILSSVPLVASAFLAGSDDLGRRKHWFCISVCGSIASCIFSLMGASFLMVACPSAFTAPEPLPTGFMVLCFTLALFGLAHVPQCVLLHQGPGPNRQELAPLLGAVGGA